MLEDKEVSEQPSDKVEQPSPEAESVVEPIDKAEVEPAKPKREEVKNEDERYRKLQSEKDKRIAELEKERDDVVRQRQEFEQRQKFDAIRQQQEQDKQQYGDTPQLRDLHARETQTLQFQQWIQQNSPKLEYLAQMQKAYDLAEKYGVSMKDLMVGKHATPQDMELAAVKISSEKKLAETQENARQAQDFPTSTSGTAANWRELSAWEKLGLGLKDADKKKR